MRSVRYRRKAQFIICVFGQIDVYLFTGSKCSCQAFNRVLSFRVNRFIQSRIYYHRKCTAVSCAVIIDCDDTGCFINRDARHFGFQHEFNFTISIR